MTLRQFKHKWLNDGPAPSSLTLWPDGTLATGYDSTIDREDVQALSIADKQALALEMIAAWVEWGRFRAREVLL